MQKTKTFVINGYLKLKNGQRYHIFGKKVKAKNKEKAIEKIIYERGLMEKLE